MAKRDDIVTGLARIARRSGLLLTLLLLLPAAAADAQETADQAAGFVIVIHESNPTAELEAKKIARMFTRRIKRWPDGESVDPIDLNAQSPVREDFTRAVHDKSVDAIQSFWQRMIFTGDGVPPREAATEKEVLEYVRTRPYAIGYVAAGAALGSGVKILEIKY